MRLFPTRPSPLAFSLVTVIAVAFAGIPTALAADATHPRVMAFRASEGDLGHYMGTGDFADADIIHEIDASVLRNVHPAGKPSIYHVAFASGKPSRCPGVYAGHWLYRAGTRAAARIDSAATSIAVEPGAAFLENGDVVLYLRNTTTGEPDWSTVEHAEVDTVDGDTLHLSRDAAIDWTSIGTGGNQELIVAPHATMDGEVIDGVDLWALNVSTTAPEHDGKSGAEAAADCFVFGYWIGVLQGEATGVEFDSARWRFDATSNPPEDVDVDNDLVADYGIPGGEAAWGRGGMLYLKELRARRPDITVQLDSSLPSLGWRAFADVDGIEMENYPSGDNWGRFSEAFQHLSTWTDRARGSQAPFSYPVTKDDTQTYQCHATPTATADIPEPTGDARFRLGLASALMIGAPHAYAAEDDTLGTKCFDLYPWPEYRGGNLDDHDWLGAARGVAKRSDSDLVKTADLTVGATTSVSEHPQAETPADAYVILGTTSTADPLDVRLNVVSVPTEEQTATILADTSVFYPAPQGAWIQYDLDPMLAELHPSLEYTVEFTASAGSNGPARSRMLGDVPRLLRVKLYAAIDGEETTFRQDVLVPPAGRHTFRLTFRVRANILGPAPAPAAVRLRFESGEETGWIRVRPRLYPGSAERWQRRFSNGVVLLNRSDEPWTATLSKAGAKHGFCTLGSSGAPGADVDFTAEVPADDALFLLKRPGTRTALPCP